MDCMGYDKPLFLVLLLGMVFLTATETKLVTICEKISAPDRYVKIYTVTRPKAHLLSITVAIILRV